MGSHFYDVRMGMITFAQQPFCLGGCSTLFLEIVVGAPFFRLLLVTKAVLSASTIVDELLVICSVQVYISTVQVYYNSLYTYKTLFY